MHTGPASLPHVMAHAMLRSVTVQRPVLGGVPCRDRPDTMGDITNRPSRALLLGDPDASAPATPSGGGRRWPERARKIRSTARHVRCAADTCPHHRDAADSASAHASAAMDAASVCDGPAHATAAASVHAAASRADAPGGSGWPASLRAAPREAAASAQEGRVSAVTAATSRPVAAPAAMSVVATAASVFGKCTQRWSGARERQPLSALCAHRRGGRV